MGEEHELPKVIFLSKEAVLAVSKNVPLDQIPWQCI
jgi:hypothetical protein